MMLLAVSKLQGWDTRRLRGHPTRVPVVQLISTTEGVIPPLRKVFRLPPTTLLSRDPLRGM